MNFFFIQLIVIAGAAIYFLPAVLAYNYRHEHAQDITLLNIFLGWTIIGWVVALIWAFSKPGSRFDKLIRHIQKKL